MDGPNIIRESENYADMVQKYQEREEEAARKVAEELSDPSHPIEAAKILQDPHALEKAKEKLQLHEDRRRRDVVPLSPAQQAKQTEPADPQVIALKERVEELSSKINQQILHNPEAKAAVLKGRVTLGG